MQENLDEAFENIVDKIVVFEEVKSTLPTSTTTDIVLSSSSSSPVEPTNMHEPSPELTTNKPTKTEIAEKSEMEESVVPSIVEETVITTDENGEIKKKLVKRIKKVKKAEELQITPTDIESVVSLSLIDKPKIETVVAEIKEIIPLDSSVDETVDVLVTTEELIVENDKLTKAQKRVKKIKKPEEEVSQIKVDSEISKKLYLSEELEEVIETVEEVTPEQKTNESITVEEFIIDEDKKKIVKRVKKTKIPDEFQENVFTEIIKLTPELTEKESIVVENVIVNGDTKKIVKRTKKSEKSGELLSEEVVTEILDLTPELQEGESIAIEEIIIEGDKKKVVKRSKKTKKIDDDFQTPIDIDTFVSSRPIELSEVVTEIIEIFPELKEEETITVEEIIVDGDKKKVVKRTKKFKKPDEIDATEIVKLAPELKQEESIAIEEIITDGDKKKIVKRIKKLKKPDNEVHTLLSVNTNVSSQTDDLSKEIIENVEIIPDSLEKSVDEFITVEEITIDGNKRNVVKRTKKSKKPDVVENIPFPIDTDVKTQPTEFFEKITETVEMIPDTTEIIETITIEETIIDSDKEPKTIKQIKKQLEKPGELSEIIKEGFEKTRVFENESITVEKIIDEKLSTTEKIATESDKKKIVKRTKKTTKPDEKIESFLKITTEIISRPIEFSEKVTETIEINPELKEEESLIVEEITVEGDKKKVVKRTKKPQKPDNLSEVVVTEIIQLPSELKEEESIVIEEIISEGNRKKIVKRTKKSKKPNDFSEVVSEILELSPELQEEESLVVEEIIIEGDKKKIVKRTKKTKQPDESFDQMIETVEVVPELKENESIVIEEIIVDGNKKKIVKRTKTSEKFDELFEIKPKTELLESTTIEKTTIDKDKRKIIKKLKKTENIEEENIQTSIQIMTVAKSLPVEFLEIVTDIVEIIPELKEEETITVEEIIVEGNKKKIVKRIKKLKEPDEILQKMPEIIEIIPELKEEESIAIEETIVDGNKKKIVKRTKKVKEPDEFAEVVTEIIELTPDLKNNESLIVEEVFDDANKKKIVKRIKKSKSLNELSEQISEKIEIIPKLNEDESIVVEEIIVEGNTEKVIKRTRKPKQFFDHQKTKRVVDVQESDTVSEISNESDKKNVVKRIKKAKKVENEVEAVLIIDTIVSSRPTEFLEKVTEIIEITPELKEEESITVEEIIVEGDKKKIVKRTKKPMKLNEQTGEITTEIIEFTPELSKEESIAIEEIIVDGNIKKIVKRTKKVKELDEFAEVVIEIVELNPELKDDDTLTVEEVIINGNQQKVVKRTKKPKTFNEQKEVTEVIELVPELTENESIAVEEIIVNGDKKKIVKRINKANKPDEEMQTPLTIQTDVTASQVEQPDQVLKEIEITPDFFEKELNELITIEEVLIADKDKQKVLKRIKKANIPDDVQTLQSTDADVIKRPTEQLEEITEKPVEVIEEHTKEKEEPFLTEEVIIHDSTKKVLKRERKSKKPEEFVTPFDIEVDINSTQITLMTETQIAETTEINPFSIEETTEELVTTEEIIVEKSAKKDELTETLSENQKIIKATENQTVETVIDEPKENKVEKIEWEKKKILKKVKKPKQVTFEAIESKQIEPSKEQKVKTVESPEQTENVLEITEIVPKQKFSDEAVSQSITTEDILLKEIITTADISSTVEVFTNNQITIITNFKIVNLNVKKLILYFIFLSGITN